MPWHRTWFSLLLALIRGRSRRPGVPVLCWIISDHRADGALRAGCTRLGPMIAGSWQKDHAATGIARKLSCALPAVYLEHGEIPSKHRYFSRHVSARHYF